MIHERVGGRRDGAGWSAARIAEPNTKARREAAQQIVERFQIHIIPMHFQVTQ